MDSFIWLLIAFLVIAAGVVSLSQIESKAAAKYRENRYFLSPAERSFYGVLQQLVSGYAVVFAKVRIADLISQQKGLSRSDWQRAFNVISSKHVDFVLCDPNDLSVKLIVELDDSSHKKEKAKRSDEIKNTAFASAGIPMIRIKAAKSYSISDLTAQVSSIIPLHNPAQQSREMDLAQPEACPDGEPVTEASTAATNNSPTSDLSSLRAKFGPKSDTPKMSERLKSCPKCGSEMVARTVKTGVKAGTPFLGCSTFPKCRAVVPVAA